MNQIYLTGDTHGNFNRVKSFCTNNNTDPTDILIILGDAGINYNLDARDEHLKYQLSQLPITLFCIHGNHEERPQNIPTYKETCYHNGVAYCEEEYPNIIFAKDGEVYDFNNKQCLVLGGAYSVDKDYRLMRGWKWFESEQIPDSEKRVIEDKLEAHNWTFDYVFSHTCPYNIRPVHLFLKSINQSTVDSSMEVWLQKLSDKMNFERWYFGHYHDDWQNGKYSMLYTDFIRLGDE